MEQEGTTAWCVDEENEERIRGNAGGGLDKPALGGVVPCVTQILCVVS